MIYQQKLQKQRIYRQRCGFIDKRLSFARNPYSMGCIDARKGILTPFGLSLAKACSHVQTKITESEFTDEITKV